MGRRQKGDTDTSVPFLIYMRKSQKQLFLDLRQEIRDIWWRKYAESLTYRDIIIRAMVSFKDKLLKDDTADAEAVSVIDNIKKEKLKKYEQVRF